AAEDAKFVMSYVKIGLSPDGGGSDALAHSAPLQAALEWLLDGAAVSAARLHELGIVNRVVPHGEALAEALRWAERLSQGPAVAPAWGARWRQNFSRSARRCASAAGAPPCLRRPRPTSCASAAARSTRTRWTSGMRRRLTR